MSILLMGILVIQKIFLIKNIEIKREWLKIIAIFPLSLYLASILYKFKAIDEKFSKRTVLVFGSRYSKKDKFQLLAFNITVFYISLLIVSILIEIKYGFSLKNFSFSLALSLSIGLISILEIDTRIKKNKEKVIEDLAYFIGRLYVYILSGVALIDAIESSIGDEKGLMNIEFEYLVENVKNGESLIKALDNFMLEMKISIIERFKTCLMIVITVGNIDSLDNIKKLENDIMANRKQNSKSNGEKIKVKMIFPLILFFLATILMLTVPMIMTLQ